jgi:amidase
MTDAIGAFVPGPRVRIEGRAGGPLAASPSPPRTVRCGGRADRRQQPRLANRSAAAQPAFWAVQTLLDGGAT